MEEVTQAITQMASHSDLTDEMKYCGHVEVAAFLLRHPDINKKKMCWNFLSGEAMPALECTLASQCREGVEGPKMVNMESDPDTLAVCREARRKPRRLESLAVLLRKIVYLK